MGYFRKQMGISKSIICYILCVPLQAEEIWAGNARLYDHRNQYQVTCRLTKEKNVEPPAKKQKTLTISVSTEALKDAFIEL